MRGTVTIQEAADLLRLWRRSIFRWLAEDNYPEKVNQRKRVNLKYLCEMHFLSCRGGGVGGENWTMAVMERIIRGEDRLLRVREAAQLLRVSRSKIYALLNDGELQGFKLGGKRSSALRVLESSLRALLEQEYP